MAEDALKRELGPSEIVHHINQNKLDNDPKNLAIFSNQREHAKFHIKLKRFGYITNPMNRELDKIRLE